MDFYSDEEDVYLTLSNEDSFPSLSEFLFGGSTPIYHHLDDILNYTADDLGLILMFQYNKYRTFFETDFKTNVLFKKWLERNDYSKKVAEQTGSLCGSILTSHTLSPLLDSIREGTTLITASSDQHTEVLIKVVNENKLMNQ